MKARIPGHLYELDNLKEDGFTLLSFYMDPSIHDGQKQTGTSCQEVLRAIIDRVQSLDKEKPWDGNKQIIQKAREMIHLFETRALFRKIQKGFPIEKAYVGMDGHLSLLDPTECENCDGFGVVWNNADSTSNMWCPCESCGDVRGHK